MATEHFRPNLSIPQMESTIEWENYESHSLEKISPEYLDEWKERTFRKEVFELFIEYFCIRQRVPFKELIDSIEKSILIRALLQCRGNQKNAAKFLGIKYTTLNEKLKRYDVRFDKKPF
jgi:DNA-binding protein Fis